MASPVVELKDEIDRRFLLSFAKRMQPRYEVQECHAEIATKLHSVMRGDLDRLMIFMPPRHGKSLLTSALFPAYYLGHNPDKRVILTSYAAELAAGFSAQARALVLDDRYPFDIEIARTSAARARWDIEGHRGGMIAGGVGSGITGRGGDLILIDDPVADQSAAESPTVREHAWQWYLGTLYTRLEAGNAAIVLIMTRWHEDDLAGRLLREQEQGGDRWEIVRFPALAEKDSPDGRDEGEALWPGRFPVERLARIRTSIGTRNFESLYQQNPRPPEGAMFKREWFRFVPQTPTGLRWTRYWDLAVSTKSSADYTASAAVALDAKGNVYIRDMIRGRWEWPDASARMKEIMLLEPSTEHIIEEALQGTAALQEFRRDSDLAHITLRGYKPDVDKVTRASSWSARAEAGKVYLVQGHWIAEFLDEVLSFPVGAHDDQVDTVSGGVASLSRGGVGVRWL